MTGLPPTPPTPAPGVVYPSHGARLVAYLIDVAVIGLIIGAMFLIFALVAASVGSASSGGVFAMFALMPIYVIGANGGQLAYFAIGWSWGGSVSDAAATRYGSRAPQPA